MPPPRSSACAMQGVLWWAAAEAGCGKDGCLAGTSGSELLVKVMCP